MSILDDARAVIANGPVCDACLGRVFADRSFGLTNPERGRSLRIAVSLDDDDPFEPAEDCWVCEGECEHFDAWADEVCEALSGTEFETYQVGTRVPPLVEENDRLLREDAGLPADAGELFKSELNREVGKRVGARTDTEVDFERPDVLALVNLERGLDAGGRRGASQPGLRLRPIPKARTRYPTDRVAMSGVRRRRYPDGRRRRHRTLRPLRRVGLPLRRERRTAHHARGSRSDGRQRVSLPRRGPRGRRRRHARHRPAVRHRGQEPPASHGRYRPARTPRSTSSPTARPKSSASGARPTRWSSA